MKGPVTVVGLYGDIYVRVDVSIELVKAAQNVLNAIDEGLDTEEIESRLDKLKEHTEHIGRAII